MADTFEEDATYVVLATRRGSRIEIKAAFKPTPAQLRQLQRTQRTRGPRPIKAVEALSQPAL